MSWFQKLLPSQIRVSNDKKKSSIPEGLWSKCTACQAVLFKTELEKNLEVCPKCQHHMRISARTRLTLFLDGADQKELGSEFFPCDALKFKDTKKYKDRLISAQQATGEKDALIAMEGFIYGMPVIACAFEFNFIGGSMGAVVGKRFVLATETAIKKKCALVCFSSSGGARMQESLVSLMQMSKTSAALQRLDQAKLPYISVLIDPCMGGVSASLAMLGDVIIAEPNALIGFAGPRVIEQTVRQTLPEGFQRSEFLLDHGAIDMIVDRRRLRTTVAGLIAKFTHQHPDISDDLPI